MRPRPDRPRAALAASHRMGDRPFNARAVAMGSSSIRSDSRAGRSKWSRVEGTPLMSFPRFGRPSKSTGQMSGSTRKSGVVSGPCHSLASLKYSFRAPVRYGPMAGRTLVGGFRHVIQSKGGTPLSVPTRWTVENGGRETMNLGTNAMSWGGVRPGGSDENRSG